MDPLGGLSVFGTILAMVQVIGALASKMWEHKGRSKPKCCDLAERVRDLDGFFRNFPQAAVNDIATALVQQRLKAALDEALSLINSCRKGGKHCCKKDAEKIDKNVSNCIMDLVLISQTRGHLPSLVPAVPLHTAYDQPPVVGHPGSPSLPSL